MSPPRPFRSAPTPITIDGTTYESAAAARRALGVTRQAIHGRVKLAEKAATDGRPAGRFGRPPGTRVAQVCGACGQVTDPPHNRRTCPGEAAKETP